jgi:hypothetical protein
MEALETHHQFMRAEAALAARGQSDKAARKLWAETLSRLSIRELGTETRPEAQVPFEWPYRKVPSLLLVTQSLRGADAHLVEIVDIRQPPLIGLEKLAMTVIKLTSVSCSFALDVESVAQLMLTLSPGNPVSESVLFSSRSLTLRSFQLRQVSVLQATDMRACCLRLLQQRLEQAWTGNDDRQLLSAHLGHLAPFPKSQGLRPAVRLRDPSRCPSPGERRELPCERHFWSHVCLFHREN